MKPVTSDNQRPRWTIGVANWWAVKLIAVFSFGFLAMGLVLLLSALVTLAFDAQADPLKDVGFALPIALTAVGALGFVFVYRQHKAREQRLNLVYGDTPRPWLYREDWAAGVVEPNDGQRIGSAAIAVAICLVIAISIIALRDWRKNPGEPVLFLAFAFVGGIGLYSLYQLVRGIAVRRRFGKTVFRLATVPGKIGGKLAGVIMAPAAVAGSERIQVRLSCIEQYSDGDGGKSESIIYKQEATITRTLAADDPGRVGLPVLFDIPASALETDLDDKVTWKLAVTAKLPGIGYHDEFVVPIFRTTTEQPAIHIGEGFLTHRKKPSLDETLKRQGIIVHRDDVRVCFYARPPRSWMLAILFILIPLVVGGMGVWAAGPLDGVFQTEVSIVFVLWTLQFVLLTPPSWFAWSRLTIKTGVWKSESSWFGFPKFERSFRPQEIADFELRHNRRSFFSIALPGADILIRLQSGEHVTAVRAVTDGPTQLALIDELRRRMLV